MIYSSQSNPIEFKKLKRRSWDWKFLASGEWSQSPDHFGNAIALYAINPKRNLAALISRSFPSIILCVSKYDPKKTSNQIIAEMLYHVGKYEDFEIGGLKDYCQTNEVDFMQVLDELEILQRKVK